ncbi:MAG: ribosome rescue protein RqcH [Candidatus Heimdallarchaeota archaeon]
MRQMSSLDIFSMVQELQGLINYRIDNVYRDSLDRFFLLKMKGRGQYKTPFLLIEPGIRIHLTEFKHSVPERPIDKILNLRSHIKGAEVIEISQIDFDRLIKIELKGKQQYRLYIELFGNRPNFLVVDEMNRVIYALWYKKMRHRDILPGKVFELPPSRGKAILDIELPEQIEKIISAGSDPDEEIVKRLARGSGGGGLLMEEILARANIPKTTPIRSVDVQDIKQLVNAIISLKEDLQKPNPAIILDEKGKLCGYQPINFHSNLHPVKPVEKFSQALDFYYTNTVETKSIELARENQQKQRLLKILSSQKKTVKEYEEKQKRFREIGDIIYRNFDTIYELLSTITNARTKNIPWEEIETKLIQAKKQGVPSAVILENILPSRGLVQLNLESTQIEVNFRKSVSEIANEYYERAKKAGRKIVPAQEAIVTTEQKIADLTQGLEIQTQTESVTSRLKRRKRKWYEKYHWTKTKNGFLVIAGKDISTNDEIAKRRMGKTDLFFHAELQGAPYTVLLMNSSENELLEADIGTAAQLAAVFSSGWKAGYGAVDVYYVSSENVGFTAPSGEYLPKGGIMVRGSRKYVRGVEMNLVIGVKILEENAVVVYGTSEDIRELSNILVTIKPGTTSKGKIAKQIKNIFLKKAANPTVKAKVQAVDLNEFVNAIPHNSIISEVDNLGNAG